MPSSITSVSSRKTVWDVSSNEDGSDCGDANREDLKSLEVAVSNSVQLQLYNPYINERPGFAPFQLFGRRKRGRPKHLGKLLPVAEQEGYKKKNNSQPGLVVKQYMLELKKFAALANNPQHNFLEKKCSRKLDFDSPYKISVAPTDLAQEEQVVDDPSEVEADVYPGLFDCIEMDTQWNKTMMISDENELPKKKLGRPRIKSVSEKIPGRKRGRPSKEKSEEDLQKVKRPRGRPRKDQMTKPKMIYSFDKSADNYDEQEIQAMLESGVVVVDTSKIHQDAVPVKQRGRPRIHPVKERLPGGRRGRPRIHAVKIKIPGRKRGRPPKPKVDGEVPKVKGVRGRPKKENQTKVKMVFSFEDKYDLCPEEMRKLQMDGGKLPEVVKNRRGRKKKVDAIHHGVAAAANGLGPKKRGRPKKNVEGVEQLGMVEKEVRKKRGPYKKKVLELPGGWNVTKQRRANLSNTLGLIGQEMVENATRSNGCKSPVTVSNALINSNGMESPGNWAMKFWQTLIHGHLGLAMCKD